MFTAKQSCEKAMESAESLKLAHVPNQNREFSRSNESHNESHSAAGNEDNEDRLTNSFEEIIQSLGIPRLNDDAEPSVAHASAAKTEEHILRCLGAAVIMEWNTIPAKLQRELFDTAGSMGDMLRSSELRGQIARFLKKEEDAGRVAHDASQTNVTRGVPYGT